MSRDDRKSTRKLDLKLNLSLLPARGDASSSRRVLADEAAAASSPSSCMSSETELGLRSPAVSPEAAATTSSMVLAGCPRCLMYVMLAEDDLKCPKCRSTVLLNFFHGTTKNSSSSSSKTSRMS